MEERLYVLPSAIFGIKKSSLSRAFVHMRVDGIVRAASKAHDYPELQKFHCLWFNLVKEYSSGQLTKEQDKLIALSGVVQRIQQSTGWEYNAGL